MILHIFDQHTIGEVQEQFARSFPGLKIEFYSKPHHVHEESDPANQLPHEQKLGAVLRKEQGNLAIKSTHTVEHVEKEFKKHFRLFVQVFRKENGRWIQTSGTDRFTLSQQMALSREAEKNCIPPTRDQLSEYGYL